MYIRREKNGEKGDCEGCEDEERGVAVGGKGDSSRGLVTARGESGGKERGCERKRRIDEVYIGERNGEMKNDRNREGAKERGG